MTNFGSSMPGKGKCRKQLKAKTKIGPPRLLWNILSTLRVPTILWLISHIYSLIYLADFKYELPYTVIGRPSGSLHSKWISQYLRHFSTEMAEIWSPGTFLKMTMNQ